MATTTRPDQERVGRRAPVAEVVGVLLVGGMVVLAFAAEPLGWFDGDVYQWLPPLSAHRDTEWHGWLALPAALAVATVAYGPRLAETLPWGRLVGLTWLTGVLWGFGLALSRGWQEGVVAPLAGEDEYLVDVPRVDGFGELLRSYTDYILIAVDDQWATHDSGHPPLPLIVYTALDRVGLGGSQDSGLVTALVGSTAVVSVLVAVRALGDEHRARAAAPFLALSPLAIWVWISADGMFAAVVAAGIAMLALASVARSPGRLITLASAAGLLLGAGIFLSYGLALMGAIAVAVLVAARQWRPLPVAVIAALAVVGVFAWLGFWWYEGQQLVVLRYYEGKGFDRPYAYWVWGNLAAAAVAVGPAAWAAGGAAVARLRTVIERGGWRTVVAGRSGAGWLAVGALVAIAAADLSGLSKSEVERIWLPFLVWLVPLAGWLPADRRRWWLAVQALWALGVCVLLRTTW